MSVAATTARLRPIPYLLALVLAALCALVACGAEEPEGPAPTPPLAVPERHRALWVLCEGSQRVLDHPERIDRLVADAQALAATDLFVQVYRGGRAWFGSTLADAGPYWEIQQAHGADTLAQLIERAHAAGLRVHAWVNVLSLASNREAPFVQELGRDAVAVDQRGRSVLDYPELDVPEPDRRYYRMGTPAIWLDPAAPGVAERLAATFGELVERYPQLDGLHLDYIRYPDVLPFSPGSRFGVGLSFGYGAPTRARFQAETGLTAPFGDRLGNANRWDAWRRDKLTELVRGIREAGRAVRPDLLISAAVWAYADRAYLSVSQDWRGWLEQGLLDFAVPMAYTLDERLLRYMAQDFARAPEGPRTWVGLGTWLFAGRPAGALAQIDLVRRAGAVGEALFSYDSIVASPDLHRALLEADSS